MLQKTTFSEVRENAALVDKRDIRTRAHDAISLYVPLPKSELFKKSNEYYNIICDMVVYLPISEALMILTNIKQKLNDTI